MRALIIGVSVNDTSRLIRIAHAAVRPNCARNRPEMLDMKETGMKITTRLIVVARTGSAISACLRQIGAVLGISVLIALLGGGQSLNTFQHAYALMGIPSAAAGILALALGRVRARDPLQTAVQTAESA